MKSITSPLFIATLVLGSGIMNSASANNHPIDDSLKNVIVSQNTQVNDALTKQLNHSIKLAANKMSAEHSNNKEAVVGNKEVIKNKSVAEEE